MWKAWRNFERAPALAAAAHSLPRPADLIVFALASTSIVSLLFYFAGTMSLSRAVCALLLPGCVLLLLIALWARRTRRDDLLRRLHAGLWAGGFATLAYDLVRLPIAHAGVPVFKAISYFGTVLLAVPRPTLASEIVGWSYHVSNGVGLALMYTALFRRPRWLSAVLWGIGLEVAMLLTPYAEVFGYRRSPAFIAMTLSAHAVYGLVLWLGVRHDLAQADRGPLPAARMWGLWLIGLLLIAAIAADFHHAHAESIPVSPPPDIGPGLYVTWSVPEPDRIGAIWLMRRFVEPHARFHFVEPMSLITFGTPFDVPEAEIRRSQSLSAFDVALARSGRKDDAALGVLARMCYMTEIRPWALASDADAGRLAEGLAARLGACRDLSLCLDLGLAWYDETYAELQASPPGGGRP